MHICFITSEFPKPGYPHGGVGTLIATLSKAMVLKGVKVSVVGKNNLGKYEEENVSGVQVYRLKAKKIKGLEWFFNTQVIAKKINEIHKQTPINVIETTELGLAFLPKIKDVSYVIRMNGGHHYFAKVEDRSTQWRHVFQEKRSFAKADAILAVSEFVKEETRELVGLGDVPIKVIYNPIDVSKFYDASNTSVVPYSIFFAGSLVEKKGIRQLVQALEYLVDDYPQVHLYIAGRDAFIPGTNKPYRPILERAISAKIKSNITFLGVVPNNEIPKQIAMAQVCCYPSHMEAMPLAWLEVLAMGKIFVGSTTGPGHEAVSHDKTGLLCDPYNPSDIAEKIRWVFKHPDDATKLGKEARIDMLKRFDIDLIVDQNIEFYNALKNN
jgi:glycosyltransferase involved in cell wall biosynthesis